MNHRVAHRHWNLFNGNQTDVALLLLGPLILFMGGCATEVVPPSTQHLQPAPPVVGHAPEFSGLPPAPMPPKPAARPEVYSVVVHNMEVQSLLFALARDAKLNVDIHANISGTVTMNVLDQTLAEILDRIARQVDMRYEMNGKSLSIMPDSPYLKEYRVDYPNILRSMQGSVSTSTNIASSGTAPGGSSGGGGGSGSNASMATIANTTNNHFWETLVANLRDLLRETDKTLPEGAAAAASNPATAPATTPANAQAAPPAATTPGSPSSSASRSMYREAASVIANAENGVISVRATQRQHERIRAFLDRVMGSARRQVLIEATIVEVDLSDRYQQGIDWSIVRNAASTAGSSILFQPSGPASGLATGGTVSSLATLTWKKSSGEADVSAALKLLESFGTLRVLSSPKLSVLNSQTSVLKVVDNEVYFTITVTPATIVNGVVTTAATYSTTVNTVPIGFLMTVTPQISENGEVILSLRPTISRITGYAMDPNPILVQNTLTNPIPIVQTREMESVLRIQSGDIAVLGGLMQDTRNHKSDEVPGLNRIPVLGEVFKMKDSTSSKSELVVFLRPTVLADASLEGDFRAYRTVLPDARNAFAAPAELPVAPAPRPQD
jgi:general secretion pathway protein D